MIKLQKADSIIQSKISNNSKDYVVEDDVVYRIDMNTENQNKQVVVPEKLRNSILKLGHESKMSGHLGNKKTLDRIRSHFYWPGISSDVKKFCNSCDLCQRTIPKGSVTKSPLGKMPVMNVPFQRVSVDLIGPIKTNTEEGHKYILQ